MNNKLFKIVITGPESTGKSTLAKDLAEYYNTVYIPEYAREYVENLSRPYSYNDLEHIAQKQVDDVAVFAQKAHKLLFLDTYLIITKVWFDVVYQTCPQWVVNQIEKNEIDLFLLCGTDLPWFPDSVRENGGQMREKLFGLYKSELEKYGLNYRIITGKGKARLQNAIKEINLFFET